MSPEVVRVAGLMSGTSLDGIDVVILDVAGARPSELSVDVVGFRTLPHPAELRDRVLGLVEGGGPRELAALHVELGEAFARALSSLLEDCGLEAGELAAVGSHGQTVWHEPPSSDARGATLQIGCAATLAERSGVPVVSDFRSRDVAAGGHGAPLVPWADWILFRRPDRGRALQNLGGMGNVTYLPPAPGDSRVQDAAAGVLAFDTGPGVALLDGAARWASGGAEAWDAEGRRARRGTPNPELLDELLADPFFRRPPPRSTGREAFGEAFLERVVEAAGPASDADWDDLLATLVELTARSVADAYRDFLPVGELDEVILTGGGARNPALVRALSRTLSPLPVRTGAEALGMDPDAREAAAFALLAWAHLHGRPGNVPAATGASGPRVLGSLTPRGPA